LVGAHTVGGFLEQRVWTRLILPNNPDPSPHRAPTSCPTSGPKSQTTLVELQSLEIFGLLFNAGLRRESLDGRRAVEAYDAIGVIENVLRILGIGDGAAMA